MKTNKKNYRHGDVLLSPAKIPAEAKDVTPKGDVILAEGEVTGHAHRVAPGGISLLKWNEKTYVRITKPKSITHEEHARGEIEPGDYEVEIQRDYEPGGWTRVRD